MGKSATFKEGHTKQRVVAMSGAISLDDSGQIRVLPQDKYDEAEKLALECNQFVSSDPTPRLLARATTQGGID